MTVTLAEAHSEAAAPRRARGLALWAAQAAVALQFAAAGAFKISGDPRMVDMFATIGAGQWLRYVVGALEVAGAVGLLVPRLCGLAAVGLAALMTGAVVANVALLDTNPALPAVLMVVASLIAAARRDQLAAIAARVAR